MEMSELKVFEHEVRKHCRKWVSTECLAKRKGSRATFLTLAILRSSLDLDWVIGVMFRILFDLYHGQLGSTCLALN
jgi:hypothetical protein